MAGRESTRHEPFGQSTFPDYLVTKISLSVNTVHKNFQVVRCCWVAVKVDTACCLQDAAHFEQSNGHHAEIGLHTLAVSEAGGFEGLIHSGLFLRDQPHPSHVQI